VLTTLLALGVLTTQAGRAAKPPSAEDVARAVESIGEAFDARDVKGIERALEAARDVPHADVVRSVVRGLADERMEVKLATLQTLRWIEHPGALDALHRTAKERGLMKQPELALAVLRGIGEHAEVRSIPVLGHDPFQPDDAYCVRARLFGLARIRTLEALEAVLGILATVGNSGQRLVRSRMGDARIALMLLTGVDQGHSPELWETWWRENRKTFRIPTEVPLLPNELLVDWNKFWGLRRPGERRTRREDRGQDEPSRPGSFKDRRGESVSGPD
jgi:hypothetical protein